MANLQQLLFLVHMAVRPNLQNHVDDVHGIKSCKQNKIRNINYILVKN